MANSVSVRVGAPGAKQASSEVDQLRDHFEKLKATAAKYNASGGLAAGIGAAATLKAFSLVGNAIGDVTGYLGDSVHAYQDQEVASGRLDSALVANVKGWNGNSDAIKAATEASVNLGFTQTDTTNAMATLVAATHDQTKALQVLGVAQDLARFKQISLGDAAAALTSIEAGRARGLAALGINVKDYSTIEERLAAVEKLAGGQAVQFAESDLGKVDVASAKAQEAQEKFGKVLSKLEAEILPAASDAVGAFADELGALQDQFDNSISPADKLREEANALRTGILAGLPGLKLYADLLNEQADALDAATRAATGFGGAMDDERYSAAHAADTIAGGAAQLVAFGAAAYGAAGSTVGATRAVKDYNDWLTKVGWTMEHSVRPAIGDVDSMLDQLFSGTRRQGQKADLFNQLHTLQDQLKKTKDKGDAKVIAGQIDDVRLAIIKLNIEAAIQSGDQGKLSKLLKHYEGEFKDTDKGAYDLIRRLETLYDLPTKYPGVSIVVKGGEYVNGRQRLATGGTVRPGGHALVGEDAPELLDVDSAGNAHVTPLGSVARSGPIRTMEAPVRANAGGASYVLNLSVSFPNAYGVTPGDGEKIGRAIGPWVASYLQKRGILPARAGAFG